MNEQGEHYYCHNCINSGFIIVRFNNGEINIICNNEKCKQIITLRTKIDWDVE